MKYRISVALMAAVFSLCACDDTTDNLGSSISDIRDLVAIDTAVFDVQSKSIIADSVLSRSSIGYIGKIKDPETGCYIKSDFMTQFYTLENYEFPKLDSLAFYDEDSVMHKGIVKADSCELKLFFDDFVGDSLAPMKVTAYEMSRPMLEDRNYYSNYDPIAEGFIRTDGIAKDKVYTLDDLTVDDDIREDENGDYQKKIRIPLNEEYIDKDGRRYDNFGTYIMQMYYDHPEYFKNSIIFSHNVVPGFYFQSKSGLGSIANVHISQLNLYFTYLAADTITSGYTTFSGTEEVLQTSNITNDKENLRRLVDDKTCTYIKSPAGIFTELTLPVDDIVRGHDRDSISMAKIELTALDSDKSADFTLPKPSTLLMIPKDSIYSFFEKQQIANYKNSFLASWSYSPTSGKYDNTYVFNNIGNMITAMNQSDRTSPDWNKVVLIPVVTSTNSSGSLTKVVHDMSLRSTRLIGGENNPHQPIKISIIYSKFK